MRLPGAFAPEERIATEYRCILKRILQVCPAFYPAISIGGPIFTVRSLQHVLVNSGNTVDVVATPLGLDPHDKASVVFDRAIPLSTSGSSGRNITYQRYYGYPHFTFSPQVYWWLAKNIHQYDVVFLHGIWNFPILAGAFVCRMRKVPYFIMPHGTLYKETVELRSAKLKKIFLKLYVGRMLQEAKRVVFTTNDERDKVLKYLSLDMAAFVMPNIVRSIDFEHLPLRGAFRQQYGIPADALMLLHYGRITKKKGIEFAIQALSRLAGEFPNIILAVVGGDDEGYRTVVNRYANDLIIGDKVIFTGLVGQSVGKQAMVDADVFVLPSLSENFGMAVVEAMLCGLPVVISNNVGIAPDIDSAGAGMVVPLTADNAPLAEAIGGLLRNASSRRTLGACGRQFAIEHYDDDAVASRVDELLATVGENQCSLA